MCVCVCVLYLRRTWHSVHGHDVARLNWYVGRWLKVELTGQVPFAGRNRLAHSSSQKQVSVSLPTNSIKHISIIYIYINIYIYKYIYIVLQHDTATHSQRYPTHKYFASYLSSSRKPSRDGRTCQNSAIFAVFDPQRCDKGATNCPSFSRWRRLITSHDISWNLMKILGLSLRAHDFTWLHMTSAAESLASQWKEEICGSRIQSPLPPWPWSMMIHDDPWWSMIHDGMWRDDASDARWERWTQRSHRTFRQLVDTKRTSQDITSNEGAVPLFRWRLPLVAPLPKCPGCSPVKPWICGFVRRQSSYP